jgi:hypothetical protein
MSANFGAHRLPLHRQEPRQPPEALDIAHLGAKLLAFAQLPLTAGNRAALQVASTCHGLMFECADQALVSDYLTFRIRDLRSMD